MNTEQFENILQNRLKKIESILSAKAQEYAKGDRLYNFKRASEIQRCSPERALLGMMMKHLVSVIDLVEAREQGHLPGIGLIDEKIGDSINYLILLEAMLKEGDMNNKCKECGAELVKTGTCFVCPRCGEGGCEG